MKTIQQHRYFQYELRLLQHQRVHSILLTALALLLAFALFDFLLFTDNFSHLLPLRLLAACGCILMLFVNQSDRQGHFALHIGIISYFCIGIFVLFFTEWAGGVHSAQQHIGLIIAMTIYTSLAPLTPLQTLFCGLLLIAAYCLSHCCIPPHNEASLLETINNLFFMVSFVLIASTQSWAETRARIREFQIRRTERTAARKLQRRAQELEQEAQRRGKEQQAAEQRYRTLYESIADAVVLIDGQGRIIQSNSTWLDAFGNGTGSEGSSLFDFVPAPERYRMQSELLAPITQGKNVTDWQIRLCSADGKWLDVEINGVLLGHRTQEIGLQLVIRDIGIRKTLEGQLRESLGKVRKMENMTILALAKISEYRDASPGNHIERIREYSRILASELATQPQYQQQVTPLYIQMLYQGSLLHDIGKVAVSDQILAKKTPLNPEEEAQFRQHTRFGGDFIREMEKETHASSFLSLARNIAYAHHECWDGSGYPAGLCGDAIPLEARIVALAHAYEDLTAIHAPEQRLSHAQAIQHILDRSGQTFDPHLVQTFVATQQAFADIAAKLKG